MEAKNNRLVVALAAALGVALLTIAYLLGRASAPTAVVTVPVAGPAQVAAAAPPTAEVAAVAPSMDLGSTAAPAPTLEALAPSAPSHLSAAPLTQSPPPLGAVVAPVSPERQQVAAYFNEADRLGDMGAGDPQAFAASLMQSISSGDFSSFDDLLTKARTQRQRLQSMTPPPSCNGYHRLALALSSDSVSMLERLKAALMKGDSSALLTMATEGKTLETQAGELKALGESIKRQAGL